MSNFLKFLRRPPTVEEERDWERENIRAKTARYLATNPLDRLANDDGYRAKVDAMAAGLEGIKGLILDIGGNTAGEATILHQRGFRMVVSDINEYALDVARQRARKFELAQPWFIACDAHQLPFADATFSAVTVIEALHHFTDYGRALSEIHRVLRPGGRFYSTEPNALNPLRRASEIRDRLRGTIEKSFTAGHLHSLCNAAGFAEVAVRPFAPGRSSWKLTEIPLYRRPLSQLNGWLGKKLPMFFAGHQILARKAGDLACDTAAEPFAALRSPKGGGPLVFDPAKKQWLDAAANCAFPDLDGIPILVPSDAVAAG